MRRARDLRSDQVAVDVRDVLARSVAEFYTHLVTRPTGRAVRLAIERQFGELRLPALSLVDLSSVAVLDYSCADEVVAKLLLRYTESRSGVFFVLRGVRPHHREPIETVLERHALAVVAEVEPACFELLGAGTDRERVLWRSVEEAGRVPASGLAELAPDEDGKVLLDALLRRNLVFQDPLAGDVHALSRLVRPSRGGPSC